jgi:type III secretion protein I
MDVKPIASTAMSGEMTGGSGAPSLPADDLVQDRFQEALNGPMSAPGVAMPPPGSATPAQGGSLGDAILSGMDRLSADFQQAWAQKNLALSSDSSTWTPAQLLQLQANVQTSSALMDVMGKGVNKVVQSVEQLTKVQ